jgi:holo-[acyl-carrier protein] synthase
MIHGIGTDNIEVRRIKDIIEKDKGFLTEIFTESEIDYCKKMSHKEEHFAARFSAKEAFMKALGTGWRFGIRFADIDVFHDALGKPQIKLSGKAAEMVKKEGISSMHVSLSHTKSMATAFVILEKSSVKHLKPIINNQQLITI